MPQDIGVQGDPGAELLPWGSFSQGGCTEKRVLESSRARGHWGIGSVLLKHPLLLSRTVT